MVGHIDWKHALTVAVLCTGLSASWGRADETTIVPMPSDMKRMDNSKPVYAPPTLKPILENTVVVTLPAPSDNVETQNADQHDEVVTEPVLHRQVPKPPAFDHCAPCPVFYRQRPVGPKRVKRRIMLNNRLSEPCWYKQHRCQHWGYYPTHWKPWPAGWMNCRQPQPGPHPYDIKPEKKKLPKDFDPDKLDSLDP